MKRLRIFACLAVVGAFGSGPQAFAEAEGTAAEGPAVEAGEATETPWAPGRASTARQADQVVLVKSARRLYFYSGPLLVRSFPVALGFEPEGPKRVLGDGRTPEGPYLLDRRREPSEYHRSIHISYPNGEDRARARAQGSSPGGGIMIHGLPNGYGDIGADHTTADWTDGCIAVTNEEMDEIWDLIDDDTPIHILP